MKTLHTIEIDASDIARIKAGEVLQIAEDTVLAYASRKVVKPNATPAPEAVPVRADVQRYRTDEAYRDKKRAYMRKWYAKKAKQAPRLDDEEKRRRKQAYMKAYMKTYRPKHGRPVVGALTEAQLMRQPHATKDGKYRCRVCQKDADTWPLLKAHLAMHLGKGGEA